jgi:hypothetical protein
MPLYDILQSLSHLPFSPKLFDDFQLKERGGGLG